jgi:hypothetical protein
VQPTIVWTLWKADFLYEIALPCEVRGRGGSWGRICRQEIRLTGNFFGNEYIKECDSEELLLILYTAMQCDSKDTSRVRMGILIHSRLIARSSLVGLIAQNHCFSKTTWRLHYINLLAFLGVKNMLAICELSPVSLSHSASESRFPSMTMNYGNSRVPYVQVLRKPFAKISPEFLTT